MMITTTNIVMMLMIRKMMMTIGYAGSIYGRYRRHLGLGPHSPISLPIGRVLVLVMMMMITMMIMMIFTTVTKYR